MDRPAVPCNLRHDRQEQEGGEQHQMHDALQHRGPAGAQGDDAGEQGEPEQELLDGAEPELQPLAEGDRHHGHRGNGETDAGQRRSERQVQAGLQLVGAGRLHRRNIDRNWELQGSLQGATVTVPALYAAGDRDFVASAPGMDQLLANLKRFVPALRLIQMIPGCGHWTQQERPNEVNAAIIDFIRGLPS